MLSVISLHIKVHVINIHIREQLFKVLFCSIYIFHFIVVSVMNTLSTFSKRISVEQFNLL